jgi:hypothetical protein
MVFGFPGTHLMQVGQAIVLCGLMLCRGGLWLPQWTGRGLPGRKLRMYGDIGEVRI